MRAVVYEGAEKVAIKEVEDAHIEEPTDVLMRVTSSALCGSDLHMYDGRAGADPGLVLGHEPLGMVEEVEEAYKKFDERKDGYIKVVLKADRSE